MEWILWVVVLFLWTVVTLGVGFAAGIQYKKDSTDTTKNVSSHPDVVEITGPMGLEGPPGPVGPEGPPGPEFDITGWRFPETDGMTLPEWARSVNTRLTRVERRAGMSV